MVGASDGKFVLPLAQSGYDVIAIEKDPQALYGGEVLLPVAGFAYAPGLVERLQEANLRHRVRIEAADLLDADPTALQAEAVWTSCSWHYSANQRRPLSEFVNRMQQLVRPGGLFGAEFMMAVEERHHSVEHYTTPDRLAGHFAPNTWNVLLTLQTDPFLERAHVGQPRDHTHRMGVLFATKHPDNHTKGGSSLDEA
ncbi:class I SAM-dependent methyltransferase [Nocardia sp. CA-135398]|uniref:class I SAM-dependent methyltransferase n=1 Tax=Nocardia sp. CA-135398 TaxID=3239977 RepID=UPI003D997DBF